MELHSVKQFFGEFFGDIKAVAYPTSYVESKIEKATENTDWISPIQIDRITSIAARAIGMLTVVFDLIIVIYSLGSFWPTILALTFSIFALSFAHDCLKFGYNISQNLPEQCYFNNINCVSDDRLVNILERNETGINNYLKGTLWMGSIWKFMKKSI
jgi:hypothetical protein